MSMVTTTTTETSGRPRWGTTEEAAAEWHVTPDTVRRWAREGRVPTRHIGRKYEFDLNYADRTRQGGDYDGRPAAGPGTGRRPGRLADTWPPASSRFPTTSRGARICCCRS